jgi:hypothetical protein
MGDDKDVLLEVAREERHVRELIWMGEWTLQAGSGYWHSW